MKEVKKRSKKENLEYCCKSCRVLIKKKGFCNESCELMFYELVNQRDILNPENSIKNIYSEGELKRYELLKKYYLNQQDFNKQYRRRARLIVFNHYGSECVCCGEDKIEFLVIDHINNDGNKFRKKVHDLYLYIIKNNFPKDLQVLCQNCNSAKSIYGYCPHELINIDKEVDN